MNFKVIISGAGPAGLAAACLLAMGGVATAVVAPVAEPDPRTTALMQPSLQMLKVIQVWDDDIKSFCAPLKQLHIIDDTGNYVVAPTLEFRADELDLAEFGWNVPLAQLVPRLHAKAKALGVTFIIANSVSAQARADQVTLKTDGDEILSAKLVIAADGPSSKVRRSLGIDMESWSFEQSAFVTIFKHSAPHENTSFEFHKSAGPFTTVPLPGDWSSLVWMDRPQRIKGLMSLTDLDLAVEIQLESHGVLGRISDIGTRGIFPMRGSRATSFAGNRCMVIGEAAHVLPPIGAQGLNMSLRDAAYAAQLVIGNEDPGSETVMIDYNRLRRADVLTRQTIVNLMNRSMLSTFSGFSMARAAGLAVVGSIPPLRQMAMQQGSAPTADLPRSMRG